MLEIPGRQREMTDQGRCSNQGICHACVVLPADLTCAPGHGKIAGEVREKCKQLMDFFLFLHLPHLSRSQLRDRDDGEVSLHLTRLKAFEVVTGWLVTP
jgi:hypothetical protein